MPEDYLTRFSSSQSLEHRLVTSVEQPVNCMLCLTSVLKQAAQIARYWMFSFRESASDGQKGIEKQSSSIRFSLFYEARRNGRNAFGYLIGILKTESLNTANGQHLWTTINCGASWHSPEMPVISKYQGCFDRLHGRNDKE
jgi:hypothetical protein